MAPCSQRLCSGHGPKAKAREDTCAPETEGACLGAEGRKQQQCGYLGVISTPGLTRGERRWMGPRPHAPHAGHR